MGCGASTEAPPPSRPSAGPPKSAGGGTFDGTRKESPAEAANSTGIDRDLARAQQQEEGKVKLLLLGAGESGKSTIFKQMRILYGTPRPVDDLKLYGVVVRSNIVTAMKKLCQHLRNLGLEDALAKEPTAESRGGNPTMSPKEAFDELISYLVDCTATAPIQNGDRKDDWVGHSPRAGNVTNALATEFLDHVNAIRILWQAMSNIVYIPVFYEQSETMKEVWKKRALVNVIDGHRVYLQDLNRIASPSYKPTTQDILLARIRTTQVIMERYRIDGIEFEMYDVGGQRSERRKWMDCFDGVDAVIFVAALSEYDQSLAESRRTNRMVEALDLFRSVCNNASFADTSIMLFLNKKDIFAEKIIYSDIAAQKPFQDYSGPPNDFDNGILYFIQKFKDCLIDDEFSDSFIHVTCATDTNNMEFVLDSTRTIIMTDNLRRSGFLGCD